MRRGYQNLTEITKDIVWQTDLFGKICYINSKATQILGYETDTLTGKRFGT
jgi:PAS domain S-box-containing protein